MRNKCIKNVGGKLCRRCSGVIIKHGRVLGRQRYQCKTCKTTQMEVYANNDCNHLINDDIAAHVKEGCSISSISRLLEISAGTVIRRIKSIAEGIVNPAPILG